MFGTELQVALKKRFSCLVCVSQLKTSDSMHKAAVSSTGIRGRLRQTVIYSNLLLMGLAKALKMRP
ncbi:hypothetical protein NTGBS_540011 [Candidatus Nitrotoga sp. BS]|nr:hypothetical protein NTGBS_540011 [Candidatus Nitrotoga sp. BS]